MDCPVRGSVTSFSILHRWLFNDSSQEHPLQKTFNFYSRGQSLKAEGAMTKSRQVSSTALLLSSWSKIFSNDTTCLHCRNGCGCETSNFNLNGILRRTICRKSLRRLQSLECSNAGAQGCRRGRSAWLLCNFHDCRYTARSRSWCRELNKTLFNHKSRVKRSLSKLHSSWITFFCY